MFFFKVEKERREKELQEEKTRFLEARIGLHEARLKRAREEAIFFFEEGRKLDKVAMETEEEITSLAEKFAGGSNKRCVVFFKHFLISIYLLINSRIIPDEMELFLWEQGRKTGSDFGPLDWKSLKVGQIVKIYNSHVAAEVFCAQEADPESPDLHFKDKREMEKSSSVKTKTRHYSSPPPPCGPYPNLASHVYP